MKGSVIGAVLFAGMTLAAAAADEVRIGISADRAECLYRVNEPVEFTVKLTKADGSPVTDGQVSVSFDNFGGHGLKSDRYAAKDRKIYSAKVSLDKPGFLRCNVCYRPEKGGQQWESFAVACDPLDIKPGSERPKDFDAFWDGAIARLEKEVPNGVSATKDEQASSKAFTCYRMCGEAFGGRKLWGFLTVPNKEGKFPVRVNVPGAGPGQYWFSMPQKGTDAVMLTMNVFDFEPAWEVHHGWKVHYERYNAMHPRLAAKGGLSAKTQCWSAGLGQSREEAFYFGAILGMNRILNWVAAQPYVDRTDITYRGQSQGGAFGIYLASLNTNLTAATISEPALTDLSAQLNDKHANGWPNPIAMQTNAVARANAERFAPYFDGCHFAPRIRCPVRFGVGFIDNLCPPHCVYAAYNALKPDVDRRMTHGVGVGHGGPKEAYTAFDQRLTDSWKEPSPARQ